MGAAIALVWANLAGRELFQICADVQLPCQRSGHGVLLRADRSGNRRGGDAGRRPALMASLGRCPSLRRREASSAPRSRTRPGCVMKQQLVLLQAWPVACAIDIAVAYYVLKSISRRSGLLPFVLLLGIATNLFGMSSSWRCRVRPSRRGRPAWSWFSSPSGLALLLRAWKVPTFWPYLALCGTISLVGVLLDRNPPGARISADRAAAAARAAEAGPLGLAARRRCDPSFRARVAQSRPDHPVFLRPGERRGASQLDWTPARGHCSTAARGRPAGRSARRDRRGDDRWGCTSRRASRWRELVVMALATSSGFAFALFSRPSSFRSAPCAISSRWRRS